MRKTVATILIDTTPETVLNAFMNFDMLNGWWGVEKALVEKRKGGMYVLASLKTFLEPKVLTDN